DQRGRLQQPRARRPRRGGGQQGAHGRAGRGGRRGQQGRHVDLPARPHRQRRERGPGGLRQGAGRQEGGGGVAERRLGQVALRAADGQAQEGRHYPGGGGGDDGRRSEERRVGKEWRSRGWG